MPELADIFRTYGPAYRAKFRDTLPSQHLRAMRAIELVKDRKSKEPAKDEVAAIIAEARAHGGLFLSAGWYGNVLRLLPPLNMAKEALAEGLDILEGAFTVVEKRAA